MGTAPATWAPPLRPLHVLCGGLSRSGTMMIVGRRWARLNAREADVVERLVPAGPPPSALVTISTLANGSRLWFAIAAALALRPGGRRAAGEGVVAALLAAGGIQVVHHVVDRPRPAPEPALVGRPDSPSFPSSHTAVGVAFTTAVARRDPRLGAALAPLAVTLAYGRVRLRVHWPTDVLGGAVLGLGAGRAAEQVYAGLRVAVQNPRGRRRSAVTTAAVRRSGGSSDA